MSALRLTVANIARILNLNEGATWQTTYSGRNSSESRRYVIEDGRLVYYASGKGAWADSRYSNERHEADLAQTRYALNRVLHQLRLPEF